MDTIPEVNWTEYVKKYPLKVRQECAAARNTQLRVTALREQMTDEGRKLRAQALRLNRVYGMNPHLISRILGISRTRTLEILDRK
jgi:hypothetical protein